MVATGSRFRFIISTYHYALPLQGLYSKQEVAQSFSRSRDHVFIFENGTEKYFHAWFSLKVFIIWKKAKSINECMLCCHSFLM